MNELGGAQGNSSAHLNDVADDNPDLILPNLARNGGKYLWALRCEDARRSKQQQLGKTPAARTTVLVG